MVNTTSHCCATARGESAHWAPASSRGWAFSLVRVYTTLAYPAACKRASMAAPITPVPIQPTVVF